jgi:hypothetical protein
MLTDSLFVASFLWLCKVLVWLNGNRQPSGSRKTEPKQDTAMPLALVIKQHLNCP